MSDKFIVNSYPVEHENDVRHTGHLDGQIIITLEAGGRGVEIKLPPWAATSLADSLTQRVAEVRAQAPRIGPAGHA